VDDGDFQQLQSEARQVETRFLQRDLRQFVERPVPGWRYAAGKYKLEVFLDETPAQVREFEVKVG
jgi:hypothetical protein